MLISVRFWDFAPKQDNTITCGLISANFLWYSIKGFFWIYIFHIFMGMYLFQTRMPQGKQNKDLFKIFLLLAYAHQIKFEPM